MSSILPATQKQTKDLQHTQTPGIRSRVARRANIWAVNAACLCFEKWQQENEDLTPPKQPRHIPPELGAQILKFLCDKICPREFLGLRVGWEVKTDVNLRPDNSDEVAHTNAAVASPPEGEDETASEDAQCHGDHNFAAKDKTSADVTDIKNKNCIMTEVNLDDFLSFDLSVLTELAAEIFKLLFDKMYSFLEFLGLRVGWEVKTDVKLRTDSSDEVADTKAAGAGASPEDETASGDAQCRDKNFVPKDKTSADVTDTKHCTMTEPEVNLDKFLSFLPGTYVDGADHYYLNKDDCPPGHDVVDYLNLSGLAFFRLVGDPDDALGPILHQDLKMRKKLTAWRASSFPVSTQDVAGNIAAGSATFHPSAIRHLWVSFGEFAHFDVGGHCAKHGHFECSYVRRWVSEFGELVDKDRLILAPVFRTSKMRQSLPLASQSKNGLCLNLELIHYRLMLEGSAAATIVRDKFPDNEIPEPYLNGVETLTVTGPHLLKYCERQSAPSDRATLIQCRVQWRISVGSDDHDWVPYHFRTKGQQLLREAGPDGGSSDVDVWQPGFREPVHPFRPFRLARGSCARLSYPDWEKDPEGRWWCRDAATRARADFVRAAELLNVQIANARVRYDPRPPLWFSSGEPFLRPEEEAAHDWPFTLSISLSDRLRYLLTDDYTDEGDREAL
eukprot:CAMPEP_0178992710 /NCGR_PEP_ID=MMETSP0795-20121207/6271_1 /TAXON_ID=88552 /ORGANISM="Amoebophrya sp., Strain Ameob2" /LENGTH=671 /DNA_ID=CAMNT_0020684633 /DNA_START=153 /DNA_END=2168 /DNA_ORIENTATION=+